MRVNIRGMKTNELRIGNFIKMIDNEYEIVTNTHIQYMVKSEKIDKPHPFSPISLTEDWLTRFGFSDKEYKKGYIGIDVNNHSFVLQKPKFMGEWQTFYAFELPQFCFVKLEFVHQLQNLFYAIESEDLTVKG